MKNGVHARHEYDCVVLVLQGGGALGAYQAGVYEGLADCGYAPDWIAGVSIGAINAALIAGNPPERRVERLRGFWDLVSSGAAGLVRQVLPSRHAANRASAAMTALFGAPGFFVPRLAPPFLMADGDPRALSFYDAAPLEGTLDRSVDFDLLNRGGGVRVSVGAVNVRSGSSKYFDTARGERIGREHLMASAALPPAFAPVAIGGEHYWDGGILSNTPLWHVLDEIRCTNGLIIQVDLFSAEGRLPQNIDQVMERHKEILYSSRTRLNTVRVKEMQRQRQALHRLLRKLPAALRDDADARPAPSRHRRQAPRRRAARQPPLSRHGALEGLRVFARHHPRDLAGRPRRCAAQLRPGAMERAVPHRRRCLPLRPHARLAIKASPLSSPLGGRGGSSRARWVIRRAPVTPGTRAGAAR